MFIITSNLNTNSRNELIGRIKRFTSLNTGLLHYFPETLEDYNNLIVIMRGEYSKYIEMYRFYGWLVCKTKHKEPRVVIYLPSFSYTFRSLLREDRKLYNSNKQYTYAYSCMKSYIRKNSGTKLYRKTYRKLSRKYRSYSR